MPILGVRCSNKDFAYAVLDGTKGAPQQVELKTLPFPKGFKAAQSLHWLNQEVSDLLEKHAIDKVVIKRFEGRTRGATFETRVEHEAAVMLAAASKGMTAVFKKVKSTIAKDLGKKGRARYLATLDTSHFPGYADLSDKQREALQAAWSELG